MGVEPGDKVSVRVLVPLYLDGLVMLRRRRLFFVASENAEGKTVEHRSSDEQETGGSSFSDEIVIRRALQTYVEISTFNTT